MAASTVPAGAQLDSLTEVLEKAKKLHQRYLGGRVCGTCSDENGEAIVWPCETWTALDTATCLMDIANAKEF